MFKNWKYIICSCAFLCTACEKEIDFEFESISPLYVIDGEVTPQGAKVSIRYTQDVMASGQAKIINEAEVSLSDQQGHRWLLSNDNQGMYIAPVGFQGKIGNDYQLSIRIGATTYVASSHLHPLLELQPPFFTWNKVNEKRSFLYLSLIWQDQANEDNYYYYKLYRNEENYAWNVRSDEQNDGEVLRTDVYCMSSESSDNEDEQFIENGDEITVRLASIDKKAYDYLRSLKVIERNGGQADWMFSTEGEQAPILGYFSAYSWLETKLIYTE